MTFTIPFKKKNPSPLYSIFYKFIEEKAGGSVVPPDLEWIWAGDHAFMTPTGL